MWLPCFACTQAWSDAARVISNNLVASGEAHDVSSAANSAASVHPFATTTQEGLHSNSASDAHERVVDMTCVHDALPWVQLPRQIIGALIELLRRLVETHGCNERNSFLTDRTFLVKAPRIMQARALLCGRTVVIPEDLRVLQYMTTYRVPPNVHKDVSTIIDGVISELESAFEQR